MTPEAIGVIIGAGVSILMLFGGILALTFRVGHMSGKIDAFMQSYERDRTDILKDIGRIEERHERHVESHYGVVAK